MSVANPPAGFSTVTPYLLLKDAGGFLDFAEKAFGARVTERISSDGLTAHAQVQIGTSMLMVGEVRTGEPEPAVLYLYVDDCDAVMKQAVAEGGQVLMEPADMFYGDRHGGIKDSWGNSWWIATHIEDVSGDELQRRSESEMKRRQAS